MPGSSPGLHHVHINGDQFLNDFKAAVELFRDDVVSHAGTFASFKSGADAYLAPEPIGSIPVHRVSLAAKNWLLSRI
jgi:hypothetical protein